MAEIHRSLCSDACFDSQARQHRPMCGEAASIVAVEKWRFKPAMKDGKPVETHMQVPLYFTLGKK
jgi:hypothetical protein